MPTKEETQTSETATQSTWTPVQIHDVEIFVASHERESLAAEDRDAFTAKIQQIAVQEFEEAFPEAAQKLNQLMPDAADRIKIIAALKMRDMAKAASASGREKIVIDVDGKKYSLKLYDTEGKKEFWILGSLGKGGEKCARKLVSMKLDKNLQMKGRVFAGVFSNALRSEYIKTEIQKLKGQLGNLEQERASFLHEMDAESAQYIEDRLTEIKNLQDQLNTMQSRFIKKVLRLIQKQPSDPKKIRRKRKTRLKRLAAAKKPLSPQLKLEQEILQKQEDLDNFLEKQTNYFDKIADLRSNIELSIDTYRDLVSEKREGLATDAKYGIALTKLGLHLIAKYETVREKNSKTTGFTMEYCSGGDLENLPPPTTPEELALRLELCRQIALAVGFIHDEDKAGKIAQLKTGKTDTPILAQLAASMTLPETVDPDSPALAALCLTDLKSGNVFYDKESRKIRLGDFGGIVPENGQLGPSTPAFDAPERGYNKPVQRSGDLYALGCIFYELIYGSRDYKKGGRYEVLDGKQIIEYLQQHPTPINDLICQLLDEDPEKRPSAYGTTVKVQEAQEWAQEELASGRDVMAELTPVPKPVEEKREGMKEEDVFEDMGFDLLAGVLERESDLHEVETEPQPVETTSETHAEIVEENDVEGLDLLSEVQEREDELLPHETEEDILMQQKSILS